MAKLLILASLLLSLVSCNQTDCTTQDSSQKQDDAQAAACPAPDPEVELPETPEVDHGEVPTEALIFDIKADLYEFDPSDEDKVFKAFDIIKKVIASKEFRNKVLNFEYKGEKKFVDNNNLSNEQIYQILLDGKEDLRPEVDHAMDLELQLYYSWRSTVGYTTPGELRIYMNTKFFDPFSPSEVAGNVFHEWTHKLGFDHASSYSVSRDSSVPYAIGYLIRDLGKQYE